MYMVYVWLALNTVPLSTSPSLPTHQAIESEGWKSVTVRQIKNFGAVEISKQRIASTECYRGLMSTSLSPKALLKVVSDIDSAPHWVSVKLKGSKLLQYSAGHLEYYQYLDTPGWTFSADRYWFLSADVSTTPTAIAFRWQRLVQGGAHHDSYQAVKKKYPKAIELPVNVGGWYFTRKKEKTEVIYAICSDVGGSVPKALHTFGTQRTLPNTMADVLREAQRRHLLAVK